MGTTNLDELDTSEGFEVDGTQVIDGDGNIVGAVTSTNGTFSGTLSVDGNVTLGDATADSHTVNGALSVATPDAFGYGTGAGGAVEQITSRTTGVTLNTPTGAITLVSAAGSTTPATFTVTNSEVAATDNILIHQKSGTDLYLIHITGVGAGSFNVTFSTTGGTTTEQPVFNFVVLKGAAA